MPAPSCPSGAKLLAAADLALVLPQPFGHAVDGDGQVAELVVDFAHADGREIALGDAGGLVAQAADGPDEPLGQQRGDGDHGQHGDRPAATAG